MMKLSEAIRLGAMLRPQKHGPYRSGDVGTCAVYAACEAVGILGHHTLCYYDEWPFLHNKQTCPECKIPDCFAMTIAHLNDNHFWTRERIADWVATIEPQDVPAQQEVSHDHDRHADQVVS